MNLIRLLPRFRKAERALSLLEQREGWSRADIEAHQIERLNAVWAHATAHVPYYRRLAQTQALPPRFGTLADLRAAVPLVHRDDVSLRPRDFRSERAAPGFWMRTSGSTGAALDAYWSHAAHHEALCAKYRMLASWGIDFFARTAFLWGRALPFAPGLRSVLPRLLQPVQDWLRNRIRLSAYHLGPEDLDRHLARMARFRPALLYGYSTAAYLLASQALARQVVPEGLRLAVLTAEPVLPRLRYLVQEALGVPTVVEYGAIECGFLAGEGPDRRLRAREDAVLVETLPRPDGRFDIVVSTLNNPSFPLLRYVIGDLTDAPLSVPARGFALLHNVSGRRQDQVFARSGRRIHAFLVDAVFENLPNARRWRVHQQADGSLSVALEPFDPARKLDAARVAARLGEIVEGYPVRVEVVPALPSSAAGKHRWVLSDLPHAQLLHDEEELEKSLPPSVEKSNPLSAGEVSS
jgi:phenylacetate-CoA ligase